MKNIYTSEFVSPKHPDKICDFIVDSILDAYLAGDKNTRAAIEIMGGHGVVTISGEVRSDAKIDIQNIIKSIVGAEYKINTYLEQQSPEIARGVDSGGAGDQGIMIGYATSETESMMPPEYELARDLCKKIYKVYPYDGKTQVTLETGDKGQGTSIKSVVASFQNTKTDDLKKLVKENIEAEEYLINPAGEWSIGGFDADSGLSGRKIVVDSYGPNVPVGGGSFSGKDATKVDRSGAYMARKIAVDYVKKFNARQVLVKLAYAIGKPQPVMKKAILDGKEEVEITDYDLTPKSIIKQLDLHNPHFAETSQWGHFGRGFKWDI